LQGRRPAGRAPSVWFTAAAQVELYDVIVVGARAGGDAAAAQRVDAIARRHRLAPGAVALGLERGVLEIHRGLIKSEALAAARVLHDLGAVAELRAARDVSGVLNIEPDPEQAPAPEPIPTPRTRRAAATPAELPPAPPFGVFETNERVNESSPPTRPPLSTRAPATAAPIDDAAPTISTTAPTISTAALNAGPMPPRFAPPAAGERIELDFASAGLSAAPVGTSALSRSKPVTGEMKRVTGTEIAAAPEVSATSGRFASESMRAGASPSAPVPFENVRPPGLFSPDRVLSVLIAAAVGAVLGLVIAFGWVRGDAAHTCAKLELELAGSIADPIAVEDGRARPPDAITKELDGKLADLRQTFFLVWAVIAIPIAGVGAIPRPNR